MDDNIDDEEVKLNVEDEGSEQCNNYLNTGPIESTFLNTFIKKALEVYLEWNMATLFRGPRVN